MNQQQYTPNPLKFFETINAHHQTAVLKTAIDLEIFSAIGNGKRTAAEISSGRNISERGTRIICDALALMGFLTKEGNQYSCTQDTAFFLTKQSPAYIGAAAEFLLNPTLFEAFHNLPTAVRKGGTALPEGPTTAANNPMWVQFAHAMAAMTAFPAQIIAKMIDPNPTAGLKVLDIAGGHGMFGIAFAKHNPKTTVYPVDWAAVLDVAKENANRMEVSDRYHPITGSAFEVDYGKDYDIVLLTNFLHHFDPATNEKLLKKVHAALKPGGKAVTLEFVPDENRTTPPVMFSVIMLATTDSGDAYTFNEYERMFGKAGFKRSELHPVPNLMQQIIVSQA